ncbi:MAG TPA: LysR substrate-binding domain-containing protein, partial [Pseudomonas sp.]|uniref:LysR substrate-binding domain-containing protein n=1 Tax=Pseudomonas sp. TaxID=306 RepID=UPI002EDA55B5
HEAMRHSLSMAELSDVSLIGLDSRDALGGLLTHHLSEASAAPNIDISVQTYHLARSLVEAGLGLAIVDPFTAYSAIGGALQVRELHPAVSVTLFALSRIDDQLSASAKWLLRQATLCAEGFVEQHRARMAHTAGPQQAMETP